MDTCLAIIPAPSRANSLQAQHLLGDDMIGCWIPAIDHFGTKGCESLDPFLLSQDQLSGGIASRIWFATELMRSGHGLLGLPRGNLDRPSIGDPALPDDQFAVQAATQVNA